jgi:hypothetical protein
MSSLVADNFRVFAAEQFIESLEEPYDSSNNPVADNTTAANNYRSKIYLFVGRPQEWATEKYLNQTSVDEFNPPDPYDSFNDNSEVYDDMIAVKRVNASDVSKVIRKVTWKSNVIYDMYKNNYTPDNLSVNGQSKLYDAQFVVMNSNYQVYKCIYNGESPTYPNGRPSTVEPTGNSTSIIESPSDGYRWKYMYTINISDYIKFVSSDFIPVKNETAVQSAAVDGGIYQYLIKNRGSGLTANTYYAPVVGDGTTQAVVRIFVPNTGTNSGKIDTVEVQDIGAGYTYGKVLLTEVYTTAAAAASRSGTSSSLGTTADVEAIISPPGGHGADASLELGGYRVMINKSLDFLDGEGDIPIDCQFRRFGLLSDPVASSNTTLDLTTTTATACHAIKFPSATTTSFTPGEIITQSTTGAKGRVIHFDTVTKVLRYYQNEYTSALQTGQNQYKFVAFSGQNSISGSTSGTTLTPDTSSSGGYFGITFTNGYASPEVKKHSGKVIYVENRKAVNRSNDQVEDIKLVIEF